MSIPDFQTFMRPLLETINDRKEHDLKEVKRRLVGFFKIPEADLRIKIPSQRAFLFDNRLGWANTYLKKAGCIQSGRRGFLQISEVGLKFLLDHKGEIKVSDLKKFDQFKQFHTAKNKIDNDTVVEQIVENEVKSPEEIISAAYEIINRNLAAEILSTVKNCSPAFFEDLVVDLLVRMGYGGSRKDAGKAIGKSGDGGIDGIINEDKLGLDSIYVQAKRWENTVPIGEIRDFGGSLSTKKGSKGVFITTSDFPKSALEFVNSSDKRIILIDGERLANLMIEYGVGVTLKDKFELKGIDSEYFEET